ncbi:MAG TPA: LD-carboxypeptidase [Clostridiales bacterium]|nr:LD-carboxypeptidase [Clostridiales bacterium]
MVKKVAIVSLSSGIIGEDYVRHEVEIGLDRLKNFGLDVVIMPHAMKGIKYIKDHPQDRAKDLLEAFKDESIDMILCAIGGDDTYRLLPYLFENDELKNAVSNKIFLGFSDTTINHFMLYKVGLNTFYGQSFLADICELDTDMLPYTKKYFLELIKTGRIERITPSDIWYEERKDWSKSAVGTKRISHKNEGYELLQGAYSFSGKILGGCLESMFDMFDKSRYSDTVALCKKYDLFPSIEEWKEKILLLETSEETPSPERYKHMLETLKSTGIFEAVSGVICGKPMDEIYFDDYKKILCEVVGNKDLPIVYNVNIGHATPRCIIPFGVNATVDVRKQRITFDYRQA